MGARPPRGLKGFNPFSGSNPLVTGSRPVKRDEVPLTLSTVVNILHKPLDKGCISLYAEHMQKAVVIRVRKETRDKLHSITNPGQTLDGIITQMIDLWEKQKKEATVAKTST